MSLTKEKIARQVIHLNSGGAITGERNRFDVRYIMSFIEPALNYLIQKYFFTSRNEDSYQIPDEFITSFYEVPILLDNSRKLYYSDLPGSIISLPDDRGLRHVSPMEDETDQFIRMPAGATGAWSKLEACDLEGEKGYWLEGRKIYYHNLPYQFKTDGVLLIKMIQSVNDLEEDEDIPMPGSMELELIETVRRLLMEKNQPEGVVNDNNAAI